MRSNAGPISRANLSMGSSSAGPSVRPSAVPSSFSPFARRRRIAASTRRRSLTTCSSSAGSVAVACACAHASSSTSMDLSGWARSVTNLSVRTSAAWSASSAIATAWWCSRRRRRAFSTSIASSPVSSRTRTGWKRRSSAGSPLIHRSYSAAVVAPITRMSSRTKAGFSMFAASIATPIAVPCPIRLCISSTKRITSGSFDTASMSRRTRSSYWPRYMVPARSAT